MPSTGLNIYQDPITNRKPFCSELYNPQGLPYAFQHYPLKEKVWAA